jgi:hypothetical protein
MLGVSNGAARELEGLPSAFAGLLPHCALSGLFAQRKGEPQSDQPENGQPMKQQNVDAETGEVVSRDNMVRGYEVAKGQYMIVEDEEIEAVQIESTRTIDIDRFVPKMRSMSVISTRRITLALMARLVRRLSPSFETPSRS